MFKNYFLLAWRNLRRSRGFSFINIVGLSIGMTATIFIMLWVRQEKSWDQFIPHKDEISQVRVNRNFNGQIVTDPAVSLPVGAAMKEELSQVHATAFTSFPETHVIRVGEKLVKQGGLRVSSEYFRVFEWTFLRGTAANALAAPDGIVLTRDLANNLFGSIDVLNQVLRIDNDRDLEVTAVVENPPVNSTIQFQFISTFQFSPDAMQDWENAYTTLYVRKQPGANDQVLAGQLNEMVKRHNNDANAEYILHPLNRWRLYSEFENGVNVGGMSRYVQLFTAIAFVILLIACINFMNLSTARSERRAREVGVRKTLGSGRASLMLQFFAESLLLSFAAFALSVTLLYLLMPAFQSLIGRALDFSLLDGQFWILGLSIVAGTGIVAGSYPAIYLSGFNPIRVLKSQFGIGTGSVLPRKILVVGQFVIGVVLLSATFVIYRQIQHVKDRDLGYNPNNLISIPASPESNQNIAALRNDLTESRMISSITGTSSPLTAIWNYTPAPDYEGKPSDVNMIFTAMGVSENFSKTTGVRMVAGTDFTGMPSDSAGLILNEAAVRTMGIKDPIGTPMTYGGRQFKVIGVTADVVMGSPFTPVEPMMLLYRPARPTFYQVRLADAAKPAEALRVLEAAFKKYSPSFPFEYQFIDQEFGQKFATETLISRLANVFAGLAILICCLGLSGLTAFTVQRRVREIGIRKVMGASTTQLLVLLSREFLTLVALALLIGIPLAWYGMHEWLQQYSYRASVGFWQLLVASVGIVTLTLLTVCLNAWSATRMNPSVSLKNE